MMSKLENIKEAIRAIDIKSHKLAHRRGCLERQLRRLEESAEVGAPARRTNNTPDYGTGSVLDRVCAEAEATVKSRTQGTNAYPDASDPWVPDYLRDDLQDVAAFESDYQSQLISGDDRVPTRPRRRR